VSGGSTKGSGGAPGGRRGTDPGGGRSQVDTGTDPQARPGGSGSGEAPVRPGGGAEGGAPGKQGGVQAAPQRSGSSGSLRQVCAEELERAGEQYDDTTDAAIDPVAIRANAAAIASATYAAAEKDPRLKAEVEEISGRSTPLIPEPAPGRYRKVPMSTEVIRGAKDSAWSMAVKCKARVLYYDDTLANMGDRDDTVRVVEIRRGYVRLQRMFEDLFLGDCDQAMLQAAMRVYQVTEDRERAEHPQRAQSEVTPVDYRWRVGVTSRRS
jgi:hypothetical protein